MQTMNFPNLKYLFMYSTHQMWKKAYLTLFPILGSLIFYIYTFLIQVNISSYTPKYHLWFIL